MSSRIDRHRAGTQITAECVIGADTRCYPCMVTDVGPEGLGIMCSAQTTVRAGARVLLRLYLPCGPILMRGRIVWVRMLTRRSCLWGAGIAMTLIDQAQRQRLLEEAARADASLESSIEAHSSPGS